MILIVIDMQKGLVDEDLYAFDTFTERTTKLVDVARKNGVEVVFVQHAQAQIVACRLGTKLLRSSIG